MRSTDHGVVRGGGRRVAAADDARRNGADVDDGNVLACLDGGATPVASMADETDDGVLPAPTRGSEKGK